MNRSTRLDRLVILCALLGTALGLFLCIVAVQACQEPENPDGSGAKAWQLVTLPLDGSWTGLHFLDGNMGYVIGPNGILKTFNGGLSWTRKPNPTSHRLTVVHFVSPDTGFLAGDGGVFLGTRDGGNTWDSLRSPAIRITRMHFLNATTGYVVVAHEYGLVFKTTDGCSTWTLLNTGKEATWDHINGNITYQLEDMEFATPSTGFACGYGRILMTMDAGETWKSLGGELFSKVRLRSLSAIDSNHVLAASNCSLYLTNDGGKSWAVRKLPWEKSVRVDSCFETSSIHFLDASNGFAFGGKYGYPRAGTVNEAVIMSTRDAGLSWVVEKRTGSPDPVVDFPSRDTGYALAGDLLKTVR